ncbi:MAG: hemolysin III family protein [Actinomycetes bacterium]|jgi:hemolysin III|nr:hemolysin III family protein [Actinomycetes bacterium]
MATHTEIPTHSNARQLKQYSPGEEIASSILHGLGAALGVLALIILIVASLRAPTHVGIRLTASIIYSLSMILEYSASTLYHALTNPRAKHVFKVLDHAAIYLLIAGTYTPFCLVTLAGRGGTGLLIFIWAFALVGIACEAFWVFRPKWVSVVVYLAMGWAIIFSIGNLFENLNSGGLWLLAAGGLAYSLGTIFYVLKKVKWFHSLWHAWVLAGSILHFLSIALYVIA